MRRFILPLFTALCFLASCDETTEGIGTSLTDVSDILDVTTTTYTASSESFIVDSVISRSSVAHLGKMKDPETDAYITANLMTQFHNQNNYGFPNSSIMASIKDGKIIADSCRLILAFTTYSGDSLSLMKCTLHELAKPVEEGRNYFSSFDPMKEGYVRKDGIHITKPYTVANLNISLSDRSSSDYTPYILFNLNGEYTDQQGNVYNNYGSYLMSKYYENKDNYQNFYSFIHNVCPGFYVESTSGVGSMIDLFTTQLEVYYRTKEETDTAEVARYSTFSGTEEVLQLTNFVQDKSRLESLVNDGSCTYLKTPSGIFTKVTLPVDDIMRDKSDMTTYKLREDTVNTVRINMIRENNTSTSDYSLPIPQKLLVLPVDSMQSFFEKKEIANYRTSFLYDYSSTSNSYSFNNISSIVEIMGRTKQKFYNEHKSDPAWTSDFDNKYAAAFPDWNKIVLVPVTTSYTTVSSSSVLTKVTNNMSLTSTRLKGGKDNPGSITVDVIYSKFRNK